MKRLALVFALLACGACAAASTSDSTSSETSSDISAAHKKKHDAGAPALLVDATAITNAKTFFATLWTTGAGSDDATVKFSDLPPSLAKLEGTGFDGYPESAYKTTVLDATGASQIVYGVYLSESDEGGELSLYDENATLFATGDDFRAFEWEN